jgi:hypothetical protein
LKWTTEACVDTFVNSAVAYFPTGRPLKGNVTRAKSPKGQCDPELSRKVNARVQDRKNGAGRSSWQPQTRRGQSPDSRVHVRLDFEAEFYGPGPTFPSRVAVTGPASCGSGKSRPGDVYEEGFRRSRLWSVWRPQVSRRCVEINVFIGAGIGGNPLTSRFYIELRFVRRRGVPFLGNITPRYEESSPGKSCAASVAKRQYYIRCPFNSLKHRLRPKSNFPINQA